MEKPLKVEKQQKRKRRENIVFFSPFNHYNRLLISQNAFGKKNRDRKYLRPYLIDFLCFLKRGTFSVPSSTPDLTLLKC